MNLWSFEVIKNIKKYVGDILKKIYRWHLDIKAVKCVQWYKMDGMCIDIFNAKLNCL